MVPSKQTPRIITPSNNQLEREVLSSSSVIFRRIIFHLSVSYCFCAAGSHDHQKNQDQRADDIISSTASNPRLFLKPTRDNNQRREQNQEQ